jgi:hypothetical protein
VKATSAEIERILAALDETPQRLAKHEIEHAGQIEELLVE